MRVTGIGAQRAFYRALVTKRLRELRDRDRQRVAAEISRRIWRMADAPPPRLQVEEAFA
jgi:hypothetical protein